jgi:hypothetical protein
MRHTLSALALVAAAATPALAQYSPQAGVSAPTETVMVRDKTADGKVVEHKVVQHVATDNYGNAAGQKYDLAVDGAFDGQTVVVIQLYTGTDQGIPFDFSAPRAALAEKGFSVFRWSHDVPSAPALEKALSKATQLWIISGDQRHLTDAHLKVIKAFYEAGHGLYLWGDNPPYTGDANFVAQALFGVKMTETTWDEGQQVVNLQKAPDQPGLLRDHLLTTGLEWLYEGHTVATLPDQLPEGMHTLIRGSQNHVVAAFYDTKGRRAILDGGFTRLYLKWDTAGTGRYVKNAAAWLANVERFGTKVAKAPKQ